MAQLNSEQYAGLKALFRESEHKLALRKNYQYEAARLGAELLALAPKIQAAKDRLGLSSPAATDPLIFDDVAETVEVPA